MPARPHARQRRAPPTTRGWLTPREYAEHTGLSQRSVRRWCLAGSVPNSKGRPVPIEGGSGRDYRIPLSALE